MKSLRLFFYTINVACAINSAPLFAENINENVDSATRVVGGICNYLEQGHAVDEIVTIFTKQGFLHDDIEKVVQNIDHILNKQASRGRIPNIIVNNKQSEEFYARKNFKEKLKNIAAIVIAIIICTGLFNFRWKIASLFERFWGSPITVPDQGVAVDADKQPQSKPIEPEVQTDHSVEPPDTQINHATESPKPKRKKKENQKNREAPVRRLSPARFVVTPMLNKYTQKRLDDRLKQAKPIIEEAKRRNNVYQLYNLR